ncbi:hypothetical protein GCM10027610_015210 [Dactylosporangium cerinum]
MAALFDQAGVIRTDTLGELLDTARVLTDQPLPAGQRLAVIGNAGGLNVLAADAADTAALTVPTSLGGAANPDDLGAEATPAALAAAIGAVARGRDADLVVVAFVATRANDCAGSLAAVAAALDDCPQLPAAVVVVGVPDPPRSIGRRRVPVFDLPEPAVLALGRAARYAAWRRKPLGDRPALPDIDRRTARDVVARAMTAGPGWQPVDVARSVLRCYGVPVVDTRTAADADEAVRHATALGYPVVVKAAAPGLVHRSDVGAVWLGLNDETAVRRAYQAVAKALHTPAPAVLVQPRAAPGWNWWPVSSTTRCSARWSCSASAACTPTCSAIGPCGCCRSPTATRHACGVRCAPLRC